MYCRECGNEVKDQDRFCEQCGTPRQIVAPAGSTANPHPSNGPEIKAPPRIIEVSNAIIWVTAIMGVWWLFLLTQSGGDEDVAGFVFGILVLLSGIIAVAVFLRHLCRWAYWTLVVFYILNCIAGLVVLMQSLGTRVFNQILAGVIAFVVPGLILIYLIASRNEFEGAAKRKWGR